MGQKVNPISFRIGVNEIWDSNWFATRANYKDFLSADYNIRKKIKKTFRNAGISQILISRNEDQTKVQIHVLKTGMLIGKKGAEIERVKATIAPLIKNKLVLDIVEVKKADLNAAIAAHNIAIQLEKRISFRRAMRRVMMSAFKAGAKGIKVSCSGRLAGAEIARTEWYKEGRLRLHTLKSAVSYAVDTAYTTYGAIGVKVWIYTGEKHNYKMMTS
ncbi:MAG: 30S ribosomal protein S3 [Alphaproteobacteria bacterium]|nr:MAG: 30S ribosomal protein S3 [Alphaproteobacteria bacterium]